MRMWDLIQEKHQNFRPEEALLSVTSVRKDSNVMLQIELIT